MASIYKRKGRKNWYIAYFFGGKRRFKNSGMTESKLAKQMANELEADISRGTHKEIKNASTVDLYREYLIDKRHRKERTNKSEGWPIKSFLRFLKERDSKFPRVSEVSKDDVRSFMKLRYDKKEAVTYNNILGIIKRFFVKAVKLGMAASNPADDIERRKQEDKEIKAFSDSEYRRIEKASEGSPIFWMILIGRYTGLRLSEMVNLEWEDVDLEEKVVHVRNKAGHTTKNYKKRVVPLCAEFIEKFKAYYPALKENQTGYVFHPFKHIKTKDGSHYKPLEGRKYAGPGPKNTIVKVLRDAGVYESGKCFHRLRKSFATSLKNKGVPIGIISEWLGHSSIRITEKYLADVSAWHPAIENTALEREEKSGNTFGNTQHGHFLPV